MFHVYLSIQLASEILEISTTRIQTKQGTSAAQSFDGNSSNRSQLRVYYELKLSQWKQKSSRSSEDLPNWTRKSKSWRTLREMWEMNSRFSQSACTAIPTFTAFVIPPARAISLSIDSDCLIQLLFRWIGESLMMISYCCVLCEKAFQFHPSAFFC